MSFPRRWPQWLTLAVALTAGLLAFANYFFPQSFLNGPTQALLKTTVLVSGGALLLAAFHLAWRHWPKARQKDPGSLLLLAGFAGTFVAGLLPGGFLAGAGNWLYHWMLAPGMAAVFALLPIFLAVALIRHLSLRDVGGALLFLGLMAVLLGQIPGLTANVPFLAGMRHDILIAPAAAAFRGVLLGIAIGSILALLRYTLLRK
ncbi:MAG TPA: hypothetical protein ENK30_01575 [Anaerolineae bacterium]|nr:hypothetical protein [Anaerolineae bacterium]